MKKFLFLPKISMLRLAFFFIASVIVFSEMGCASKPGCGSRRDHRVRKRSVHKFAPSMGYNNVKLAYEKKYFFA